MLVLYVKHCYEDEEDVDIKEMTRTLRMTYKKPLRIVVIRFE